MSYADPLQVRRKIVTIHLPMDAHLFSEILHTVDTLVPGCRVESTGDGYLVYSTP